MEQRLVVDIVAVNVGLDGMLFGGGCQGGFVIMGDDRSYVQIDYS